jgi:O-antigen ligase
VQGSTIVRGSAAGELVTASLSSSTIKDLIALVQRLNQLLLSSTNVRMRLLPWWQRHSVSPVNASALILSLAFFCASSLFPLDALPGVRELIDQSQLLACVQLRRVESGV